MRRPGFFPKLVERDAWKRLEQSRYGLACCRLVAAQCMCGTQTDEMPAQDQPQMACPLVQGNRFVIAPHHQLCTGGQTKPDAEAGVAGAEPQGTLDVRPRALGLAEFGHGYAELSVGIRVVAISRDRRIVGFGGSSGVLPEAVQKAP